nr:DUF1566 domain-containing protein [Vibrio owensii]
MAYLRSIGAGYLASFPLVESEFFGPSGKFAQFRHEEAKDLCQTYSEKKVGNRTNWRLPTKDELMHLYKKNGSMFTARGWPTSARYWSDTSDSPLFYYYYVSLANGWTHSKIRGGAAYTSCVSED